MCVSIKSMYAQSDVCIMLYSENATCVPALGSQPGPSSTSRLAGQGNARLRPTQGT